MVILAAARVGGILANWEYPYEFVQENLAIELNVIHEAFRAGVRRLMFLGSSCIYPRLAPQPLKEEYLLTGPLEETNRPCNFDLETSHLVPACSMMGQRAQGS